MLQILLLCIREKTIVTMNRILLLALLLSALTVQAQTEKRIYTKAETEEMSPNGKEARQARKLMEKAYQEGKVRAIGRDRAEAQE